MVAIGRGSWYRGCLIMITATEVVAILGGVWRLFDRVLCFGSFMLTRYFLTEVYLGSLRPELLLNQAHARTDCNTAKKRGTEEGGVARQALSSVLITILVLPIGMS